jgi:CRISPR-associated protein Cmr1
LAEQKLEIKLKTLTPLWTGGVQAGKMDRLHETGIIGSLRWWYEALLRGVGGHVCNPMGSAPYRPSNRRQPANPNGKCQVDSDHLPSTLPKDLIERRQALYEAGLCDVCQIFGTTGWRRRFRLGVDGSKLGRDGPPAKLSADRTNTQGKRPTWYFKTQALAGSLQVQLIPIGDQDVTPVITGLLQFIADWSALGARPQLGFGVVSLPERVDRQTLYDRLALVDSSTRLADYGNLPALHNLFFARLQAPSQDWKEVLNLKYDLRQLFAGTASRELRHSLFGTVRGDRRASKVRISAPYGNPPVMRVWGWVPTRDQPLTSIPTIHTHLSKLDPNLTWRELNSSRDTVQQHSQPLEFLADLLEVT